MQRKSPRFTEVNEPLRSAIADAMARLGLGVTSPEIDASTNTVRKVLDPDGGSVHLGTLAKLVLSLEMLPRDAVDLGCSGLAAEMTRRLNEGRSRTYTDALRRTMETHRVMPSDEDLSLD